MAPSTPPRDVPEPGLEPRFAACGDATLEAASAGLGRFGLILRGGFDFGADEPAPPGPGGTPTRSVLLVGQAGPAAWGCFRSWRAAQPADPPDPLDQWSREAIGTVADDVGALAAGPNDRPFLPFQQWAMRAEGLRPSPLGLLMHPRFGLWHAYRGALLFDRPLGLPPVRATVHHCDDCVRKPCLDACPVQAHSRDGFRHGDCRAHLQTAAGGECMSGGCLARNACPIGAEFRYSDERQAFHMRSFAGP